MNESEKFILLKGSGGAGLGDKIRALMSAILYAKLSGRTLCVDWQDTSYSDGSTNIFEQLFELKGIPSTQSISNTDSVRPSAWRNRLNVSFDQIRALDGAKLDGSDWNRAEAIQTYSFDQTKMDYPEDVLVLWEFDQFEKMLAVFPEAKLDYGADDVIGVQAGIVRKHLKVRQSVFTAIDTVQPSTQKENFQIIGVHVRLTDESESVRSTPSLSQYWRAIDRFVSELDSYAIYLSTDNSSVVPKFQERYGNDRILFLDKWFPEPGQSLHKNLNSPDPTSVVRDAMREVLLLAQCQKLVVLHNSSFSFLARIFSPLKDEDLVVLIPEIALVSKVKNRLVSILGRKTP